MNDEALPSYSQILMNFDTGLTYLDELFGVRPNIGWQVDPFGQSKVHVSILSKLGYDGLISNRVSNTIKGEMRNKYGYSFEWKGHDVSWDKKTSTIAHYLEYFYVLPVLRMDSGFIWTDAGYFAGQFWNTEILPGIEGQKSMGLLDDFHVVAAFGDDFAFQQAS